MNAALNGVVPEFRGGDAIGAPLPGVEVLLAGDVFYERSLAANSLAWFRALAASGVRVLAGDAGRTYGPRTGFEMRWRSTTSRRRWRSRTVRRAMRACSRSCRERGGQASRHRVRTLHAAQARFPRPSG